MGRKKTSRTDEDNGLNMAPQKLTRFGGCGRQSISAFCCAA
jgi:hypothetical protein